MEGLIEEGKEATEEGGEDALCDAQLIAAAQRVEHYEISAYGTARAVAKEAGATEVVTLLTQTLEEEKAAAKGLTKICMEDLYPAAARA